MRAELEVLQTKTFFQRVAGRFSHRVHDGAELFGAEGSVAKVLDVDAGRFDNSTLERVLFELATELNERLPGVWPDIGIGCPGNDLTQGAASLKGGCGVATYALPIDAEGRPVGSGGGQSPVVDESSQSRAHPFREGRLFDQVDPRGYVHRTLVDVGANAVGLLSEKGVDGGGAIRLRVELSCGDSHWIR